MTEFFFIIEYRYNMRIADVTCNLRWADAFEFWSRAARALTHSAGVYVSRSYPTHWQLPTLLLFRPMCIFPPNTAHTRERCMGQPSVNGVTVSERERTEREREKDSWAIGEKSRELFTLTTDSKFCASVALGMLNCSHMRTSEEICRSSWCCSTKNNKTPGQNPLEI